MTYDTKIIPEVLWAVAIAALTEISLSLTGVVSLDDPKGWAVALIPGLARAVIGAALTVITRSRLSAN